MRAHTKLTQAGQVSNCSCPLLEVRLAIRTFVAQAIISASKALCPIEGVAATFGGGAAWRPMAVAVIATTGPLCGPLRCMPLPLLSGLLDDPAGVSFI